LGKYGGSEQIIQQIAKDIMKKMAVIFTGILNGMLFTCASMAADPKPPSDTNAFYVLFLSGAKFDNPFRININHEDQTGTLTNRENSTDAFIEFSCFNRFVMRGLDLEDYERDPNWQKTNTVLGNNKLQFLCPGLHFPDYDINVGFIFRNGSDPTNLSASTIAGGGDFYSEGSIGIPILRYSSARLGVHQITIEAAGGFATEKCFMTVHPNMFFGAGYQGSFNFPAGKGYFASRVGYGWVDTPIFSSNNRKDVMVVGDLPQFKLQSAATIETSLVIPVVTVLNAPVYAVVRANVYLTDNPNPWSITVGGSVSIDKLFGWVSSTKKE
jgi:hypothetical protein